MISFVSHNIIMYDYVKVSKFPVIAPCEPINYVKFPPMTTLGFVRKSSSPS